MEGVEGRRADVGPTSRWTEEILSGPLGEGVPGECQVLPGQQRHCRLTVRMEHLVSIGVGC